MEMLMREAILIILKNGLTKENIEKVVKFIIESGKKVSDKLLAYLKSLKKQNGVSQEGAENSDIPAEVQDEVKASIKEILESAAKPVYMDGVALFCDQKLTVEEQEDLELFLTSDNFDQETELELTDEDDEYLNIVKKFVSGYCGNDVSSDKGDFAIEDDVIYLNFASEADDYFRVYKPDEIREFINALNHLLDNRCITRFTVY